MSIRTRAWRRAQRQRAIQKAKPIIERTFGAEKLDRVLRFADNLRKCSCPMCNTGNPHDSRQFRRADAAAQAAWD